MAIQQSPYAGLRELALFAGAGGGILGGHLLGWRTVAAVERDAYAAAILAQRQNDGLLKAFPIWSDVTTFDGKPWNGIVDVVSGGFPCQDISIAGAGAGITGERSGLWKEMYRIVGEIMPCFVHVENSSALTYRGLGIILGNLAALGYCVTWECLSASDCGAPHGRDRIWILGALPDTNCKHAQGQFVEGINQERWARQNKRPIRPFHICNRKWPTEPGMGRVADGMAFRSDRLKALGNGQVPIVAAAAFHILMQRLNPTDGN